MKWKSVFLAARPKTLPAGIVPVWTGCVLAWSLSGTWHLWLAVCILLSTVCIQIATNFFNDAIDFRKGADTEARTGPRRMTAQGMMSYRAVMSWALIFCFLAILFGVPLVLAAGFPVVLIGIVSLFFAYGYTGGPFPLAYRGMGELFVILFFGFVAVLGTVYVQLQEWRWEAALLGAQVGLLSAVLISINNLRDRVEDAETGKRTYAVRFGPKVARLTIWAEIKLPMLLGLFWLIFQMPWFFVASFLPLTLGMRISWGALREPEGPRMNRLLTMAGVQLILFAAVFHLAAVLVNHTA